MPTYRVTPDELPILFRERHANRVQRVVKAIQDTVITAGPGLAQAQIDALGKYKPVNTTAYRKAWQAVPLENGAVLFNDSPYASIIEKGRRRNSRMPPKRVIEEWLEQKLRGQVKNRKKRRAQAKSIAFVVARAIARRGLPAKHIMKKTKRKLDPMVKRAVQEALSR